MKNFKNYVLVGITGLSLLLTSCLGDGKRIERGTVAGVINSFDMEAGRTVLDAGGAKFYFPGLEDPQFTDGSCWFMNIEVNYDNQISTKYLQATLLTDPIEYVRRGYVNSFTDNIPLDANEQTISDVAIISVVKNMLFLDTAHKNHSDQKNQLSIYYKTGEESVTFNVSGTDYNMYTLYVRSICSSPGEESSVTKNETLYTAFDLGSYLESKKAIEKDKKNTAFIIQVKYIKEINGKDYVLSTPTAQNRIFVLSGFQPDIN